MFLNSLLTLSFLSYGCLLSASCALDMADLRAKKQPLSKMAYQQRVRGVLRTKTAQRVASNIAKSFQRTCKEVAKRKGAAARG